MVSDIFVAVLHGRSPCVPNQLRLFGGACGGKRVAGRFVQHGERVGEIVGGRDDTEILGEKNFSVQEERSGGSTRRNSWAQRDWGADRAVHGLFASPPGFECSFHSAPLVWGTKKRREVCCGKARTGRALQRCKNERAALAVRKIWVWYQVFCVWCRVYPHLTR